MRREVSGTEVTASKACIKPATPQASLTAYVRILRFTIHVSKNDARQVTATRSFLNDITEEVLIGGVSRSIGVRTRETVNDDNMQSTTCGAIGNYGMEPTMGLPKLLAKGGIASSN